MRTALVGHSMGGLLGKQVLVEGADHVTLVTHRDNALAVVSEIGKVIDAVSPPVSRPVVSVAARRPAD